MRNRLDWEAYYKDHPEERPVFRFDGVDYPTTGAPGTVYEDFYDWYNDAFCVLIVPEQDDPEKRVEAYRKYWTKVQACELLDENLKQFKLDRIKEVALATKDHIGRGK